MAKLWASQLLSLRTYPGTYTFGLASPSQYFACYLSDAPLYGSLAAEISHAECSLPEDTACLFAPCHWAVRHAYYATNVHTGPLTGIETVQMSK
jgi:hypothetical protein